MTMRWREVADWQFNCNLGERVTVIMIIRVTNRGCSLSRVGCDSTKYFNNEDEGGKLRNLNNQVIADEMGIFQTHF